MPLLSSVLAICLVFYAEARPGLQHGGGMIPGGPTYLTAIPSLEGYGHLSFPKQDILDLGEESHEEIPPKTIHIYKKVTVTVPKPYEVKVPYKVPYPVPVHKPYPVPVTKLVKVAHPVPVEVIKKVPVPIEVPKPYPVPVNEHHGGHGHQGGGGGDLGGHQQQLEAHNFAGAGFGTSGFEGHSFGASLEGHQELGHGNGGFTPSFGGEEGHDLAGGHSQLNIQQESGGHEGLGHEEGRQEGGEGGEVH